MSWIVCITNTVQIDFYVTFISLSIFTNRYIQPYVQSTYIHSFSSLLVFTFILRSYFVNLIYCMPADHLLFTENLSTHNFFFLLLYAVFFLHIIVSKGKGDLIFYFSHTKIDFFFTFHGILYLQVLKA